MDGDLEARQAATSLLGLEGDILPDTAPNVDVALEKLSAAQYDAIVSDYVLPGSNGIDLLRTVRGGGNLITFIIYTDLGNEEVATDAIINGADTYLPWTGNLNQDMALVRTALTKRASRKRREAADVTATYQALLKHMHEAFVYFRIVRDEQGGTVGLMVQEVSEAFEELMGVNREMLLARWAHDIIPEREGFEKELRSVLDAVARSGGDVTVEGMSMALRRRLSATAYSPEPGFVAMVIAGCRDPVEGPGFPKEGYSDLYDIIPALISIKDPTGRIMWTNRAYAEFMGTTPEALKGRMASEFLTGEAGDFLISDQEVLRTGGAVKGVIRSLPGPRGEKAWLEADKLPYQDVEGRIVGVITFAQDITDRKKTEDALALANKKLNLLGSITSHDLLNQLTALFGYLDIADYKGQEKKVKEFISKARGVAESMHKTIMFSRDYERMGEQGPEWSLAQEMAEKGIASADISDVRVIIELDGLVLYADRMLEKVFHNLVDNAKRHGDATRIRLFTERDGESLRIICQDNGRGISPDRRGLMFDDRFGHGLYLVQEILAITGMRISETSRPDEGGRFEIEVPPGSYRSAG